MNFSQTARNIVANTLRCLPKELRSAAENLPVIIETLPNKALLADGIGPDTLGLFVGASHHCQDDIPAPPPQIFLFLENILQESQDAGTTFAEEVKKTYLHELGHYLGLDEADLALRGLE